MAQVTFLLYKNDQGGAPLWLETQNVRPDKAGRYSVMLGSATAHGMPADLFASGEADAARAEDRQGSDGPQVSRSDVFWMMRKGWDYEQVKKFGSHAGQPEHRDGVQ